MKPFKLLIFSVSAGAGHMRAAEAVRAYAQLSPMPINVTHVDLMTIVPDTFRRLYTDTYIKLIENSPAVWGFIYNKTNMAPHTAPLSRLRRAIERLNIRPMLDLIEREAPDHILCTHFMPAELLAHEKKRGRFAALSVSVQVTDFDLHRMWVHENMSAYFTANDEVAFRLIGQGIDPAIVHATGIPIMPNFAACPARETCAAELGIDPNKLTLLMMSGGVGLSGMLGSVERLLDIDADFQIVALAGRNGRLLNQLRGLAQQHPQKLFPQGYTTTIERMMACADVAITKPGGLTASECLAVGLPMILISPIPGQEEHNADYLLEQGVALKAYDAAGLEWRVRTLQADPGRLAAMRARMASLGRARAALQVLDIILQGSADE